MYWSIKSLPSVNSIPEQERHALWESALRKVEPPGPLSRRMRLYPLLIVVPITMLCLGSAIAGAIFGFACLFLGVFLALWLHHIWWINTMEPRVNAYIEAEVKKMAEPRKDA